jgi:hypothetical protein
LKIRLADGASGEHDPYADMYRPDSEQATGAGF